MANPHILRQCLCLLGNHVFSVEGIDNCVIIIRRILRKHGFIGIRIIEYITACFDIDKTHIVQFRQDRLCNCRTLVNLTDIPASDQNMGILHLLHGDFVPFQPPSHIFKADIKMLLRCASLSKPLYILRG